MNIKNIFSFIAPILLTTPVFAEVSPEIDAYLSPAKNHKIGMVFEASLSPHQESGEEEDASEDYEEFISTEDSFTRDEREANKHGGRALMRFTKDMSKVYVDVKLDNVKNISASDEIVMFHIHCGRPGILGPIIIDFALTTDINAINTIFANNGVLSVVLTNKDITDNNALGDGSIEGLFSRGCFIPQPSLESDKPLKTTTIAGLAYIAQEGDLYFNLHTAGQTFYGDMRGQVYPLDTHKNRWFIHQLSK